MKIVFTIKVHLKSNIITINKWEPCTEQSHQTQHIKTKKGDKQRVPSDFRGMISDVSLPNPTVGKSFAGRYKLGFL